MTTPINYEAWARGMISFIRHKRLELEFQDYCGGWPCPVAASAPPAPSSFCWFIERNVCGQLSGEWLTFKSRHKRDGGGCIPLWTRDPMTAIRFSRSEDANAVGLLLHFQLHTNYGDSYGVSRHEFPPPPQEEPSDD